MFGLDFEIRGGVLVKYKGKGGNVVLPKNITEIGNCAFYNNRNGITSIKISDGVKKINQRAFACNDYLTTVIIPEGVTAIDDYAFFGCVSLTDIRLPQSLVSIGKSAFKDCTALKSINIPKGVTTIGSAVFCGCDSLGEIKIDGGNTSYKLIDGNLYTYDGKTLHSYISRKDESSFSIPEGVTKIGNQAFAVTHLNEIIIPEGVTEIGEDVFNHCESLTSVKLPNTLKTIGNSAFLGAETLGEITIPAGVKFIGSNIFNFGTANKIVVDQNNKYFKFIDGNLYYYAEGNADRDICVSGAPQGIAESESGNLSAMSAGKDEGGQMLAATGSSEKLSLGGNAEVKRVGKKMLHSYYKTDVESFVIPSDVTSIGNGAFKWHRELTGVVIPDGLKEIGNDAFAYCEGIKEFNIPDSVTSIGESAFMFCTSLTTIKLPKNIREIQASTLLYCPALTDLVIPESVTKIYLYAFSGCDSLAKLIIPAGVKSIDKEIFGEDHGKKPKTIIYCRIASAPFEWAENWNSGAKVVWNYKGN